MQLRLARLTFDQSALSKAGYSVLQLDQQSYYGDIWASLSVQEVVEWANATPGASCSLSSPPEQLLPVGQRFSLSLLPTLLRANGSAIDLLVRSKVAAYLSFGMLNGIGLWSRATMESDFKGKGKIERVPSSKADVFNHPTLSLVEKRRLTKLLLLAAGHHSFEENTLLKGECRDELIGNCQLILPLTRSLDDPTTLPKDLLQPLGERLGLARLRAGLVLLVRGSVFSLGTLESVH